MHALMVQIAHKQWRCRFVWPGRLLMTGELEFGQGRYVASSRNHCVLVIVFQLGVHLSTIAVNFL